MPKVDVAQRPQPQMMTATPADHGVESADANASMALPRTDTLPIVSIDVGTADVGGSDVPLFMRKKLLNWVLRWRLRNHRGRTAPSACGEAPEDSPLLAAAPPLGYLLHLELVSCVSPTAAAHSLAPPPLAPAPAG